MGKRERWMLRQMTREQKRRLGFTWGWPEWALIAVLVVSVLLLVPFITTLF